MRLIAASAHHALDFITVVAFAIAPTLLQFTGVTAILSYALAAVHLGLTLLTQFSDRCARPVPLRLHGAIECVVGIALIALPWIAGWTGTPRVFFTAAGAVILLVWETSDYRASPAGHTGPAS
jgi:hypothetical protein